MEQEIATSVSGVAKLIEYGGLGVVIVFLMGYVIYIYKSHRTERKELHKCHAQERKDWRDTTEKQFEESHRLGKKVIEVLSEVKGALNTKRSGL